LDYSLLPLLKIDLGVYNVFTNVYFCIQAYTNYVKVDLGGDSNG